MLRLDVMQRLVDAGEGRHGDDAALEEGMAEHHLPEMLDVERILAADEQRQVLDVAPATARVWNSSVASPRP